MRSEIQKLNSRHLKIIDLLLMGTFTQKQIAQFVGLEPNSIQYITNSPIFQEELARRRAIMETKTGEEINNSLSLANEMIQNSAPTAVGRIADLMDSSPDDSVKLRAAESILKMAFGRERDGAGGQASMVVVLDASKLGFLQHVAKEAGLINGESSEPVIGAESTAVVVTTRD